MAVRTPGVGLPGRPRLLAPTFAVVAVLLLLGGIGVSLYTDLLWFQDVGFSEVFSTVLRTRLLLFVGFGLLMAITVGANVTVAYRVRPPFRPMSLEQQNLERYRVAVEPFLVPVLLLGSSLFGLFAGLSAASRWQTYLLWRNRTSFGQVDPQFHRDVSYYAMTYPFQRFVLGFLLTAVVLSLLAAAATHYLFGGVRLQTAGDKVSPGARAHLSVLVGLVLLLKAVAYYLDRFGLVFSTRGRVQGASFTDINAVLPAKNVLIGVAVICALLAFANIVVRNILLPGGAVALLVVTAVVFGGIYPAYTQQFRVKPNEIEREAKFIGRNIDATRKAYSIDDVVTTPYSATGTANAGLRTESGTVENARLLDPNVVSPTFVALQRQRGYFTFSPDLDVDRYDFGDGSGLRDYVVGARELNLAGLAGDQKNWINEHLIYTHGNGIVAAPANDVSKGEPQFVVKDLPVTGPAGFRLTEPRIYFGEGTTDYSVVATKQEETDGPVGGSDAPTYNYTGTGGVELSNPLRKVAYALKFREKNLLLSNQVDDSSKLQYIREPRERVQKVAPFLELDDDPYPAVVGGKILWIVDGYTTSAGYPYAERTTLGQAVRDSQTRGPQLPAEEVNYIRNSVKATVDAFSGKVTLYTFDDQDPVLKTWDKAFGGLLQPKSAIPKELAQHFRYPEDLFKVQRQLLSKYHIENPREFFQGDDYWQIPGDPGDTTETPATPAAGTTGVTGPGLLNAEGQAADQPPYYVVQQFPGTGTPSFNLTTTFVSRNGPNLTAVASVSGDPGADYGKIRLLELPRNRNVAGPRQVAALFNSAGEVRGDLLPLAQRGSTVIPGNLLTLPVGNNLLYVLPIYVKAAGNDSFPTLQLVLGAFGQDRVASAPTFAETLDELFGRTRTTPRATPSPGASASPTAPGDGLQPLADAVTRAFEESQAALARNDFAAYGAAQGRLQQALQALADASGTPAATSPSAAPSPAASGR
ncbi:MAG: hypothetical protein JWN17_1235 [Frankiales bacterium]|nr:hypothetical protein [Frankiales bacterium]